MTQPRELTNIELMEQFNAMIPSLSGMQFKPIQFTPSESVIPGVRTEYLLTEDNGGKVQFHFWKDPEFPADFGEKIAKALRGFPEDSVVVEYVPEVDSWYTHVQDFPMGVDAASAERLVRKIATAVSS